MKYLSVCSGIEAATAAWHPLGWEPFAFSEIEKFPAAVLNHHYPNTPNFGDMTKFKEWPDATIDVLVGGTPCQSFSTAGLRKGLDDPRGNLMLTYQQPCVHCKKPGPGTWHHSIGFGSGIMAGKASDIVAVPICGECHHAFHADYANHQLDWMKAQLRWVEWTLKKAVAAGVVRA